MGYFGLGIRSCGVLELRAIGYYELWLGGTAYIGVGERS